MQRSADAGEAPLLIDPQVGDEVRHAEAELRVVDRERVVVDDRAVGAEEAGRGDVNRAAALVAGSSAEMVPEKPLPNWAV
jgi:hypothetical protein